MQESAEGVVVSEISNKNEECNNYDYLIAKMWLQQIISETKEDH